MSQKKFITIFVVAVAIIVAIGGGIALRQSKHVTHVHVNDHEECLKASKSFNGTTFTYKVPAGTDCSPYQDEIHVEPKL